MPGSEEFGGEKRRKCWAKQTRAFPVIGKALPDAQFLCTAHHSLGSEPVPFLPANPYVHAIVTPRSRSRQGCLREGRGRWRALLEVRRWWRPEVAAGSGGPKAAIMAGN
jgi:hypothetical protein